MRSSQVRNKPAITMPSSTLQCHLILNLYRRAFDAEAVSDMQYISGTSGWRGRMWLPKSLLYSLTRSSISGLRSISRLISFLLLRLPSLSARISASASSRVMATRITGEWWRWTKTLLRIVRILYPLYFSTRSISGGLLIRERYF